MMDWAKATETEIAAAYSCHGAILAGDGDGLIASALRKAKADGMREAARLMTFICVSEIDAKSQKELRDEAMNRANQIEKGQE